jgi:hypothetical protein
MSNSIYKAHMLRCIAEEPRTLRSFTDGKPASLVYCAQHVERYASELNAEGLIVADADGKLHITDAGEELLSRPMLEAEPRQVHMTGRYVPPTWTVRDGGDAHRQFRSRGIGA